MTPLAGTKAPWLFQLCQDVLADEETALKVGVVGDGRDLIGDQGDSTGLGQFTLRLGPAGEILSEEGEGLPALLIHVVSLGHAGW